MTKTTRKARVRTVEYEPGWGWIARNPATGEEVLPNFRWRTRSVARDVVWQAKTFHKPIPSQEVQP